jgi:hypothetical protein
MSANPAALTPPPPTVYLGNVLLPDLIRSAVRPISSRRLWRVFAASLIATIICCGAEDKPPTAALSPDERYLVDAYVSVRRAGALYPYQHHVADSVLARLAATVDTVRVARTISSLNTTPERWSLIFRTIEEELSPSSAQPSESTRG